MNALRRSCRYLRVTADGRNRINDIEAQTWPSADLRLLIPERTSWRETSFFTDTGMFLDRNGYLEETYFTFSFSPIRDEHGRVAGVFHPVTETTHLVLAKRRLSVLRRVADRSVEAKSVDESLVCA